MRRFWMLPILAAALVLAGCVVQGPSSTPSTTQPILTGWQDIGQNRYYYDEGGKPVTGWLNTGEGRFYLNSEGILQLGFVTIEGETYYLPGDGQILTGSQQVDGNTLYFTDNGCLWQGWMDTQAGRQYLQNGVPLTGWQDIGENRYYFGENAIMHTGWLESNGDRYFFRDDGRMGKGKVSVSADEVRYFTSTGKEVILVNPWNYVPEDYSPTLVSSSNYRVSEECLEALKQMLADCKAAGFESKVVSSYRSYNVQKQLYENRVRIYLNKGYSQAEAERIAATINAIPGTSEHQLGLAVDIVDVSYQVLNKEQENTPAQKWLLAHCWDYGFILRYPNDRTDVTGIIYEPWHYRYVGLELASELKGSGLCLEEYLDQLTED